MTPGVRPVRPPGRSAATWTAGARGGRAGGAAASVAFCATMAAAFVALACAAAPAFSGTFVNPTPDQIRAKLYAAAVARDIPPKILYAIAYQESGWRQFDANGDPLVSADGGIGIMQVTSYGSYDVERLTTDIDYDIAAGADILLEKWGYAPSVIPVIGDGSQLCYEDWFYAVWAYNGWVPDSPYPYQVWALIATGPQGWWTGLPVTPVPQSSLVDGLGVTIPTPLPAHYWSPVPLPKPVLGAPQVPARVAAGARFTVSGTLSPQHPAGESSVEIRCFYRTAAGWALRRAVTATNQDSGDLTRYVASFALAKAGRWRLRAYAPADAEHAAVSSTPSFVTVR